MTIDYSTIFGDNWKSIIAVLGGFLIGILIIVIALVILMIIANWKYYKKAGRGGWESIIPFYNKWVLVEIAGLNWWWFLLLIASNIISIIFGASIPGLQTFAHIAVIFASLTCNYNISKKLHQDIGFAILLTIFPIVMIPIVAFSKSYQFDHSIPLSKNGLI